MGVTAVHQFISSFVPRDAVSAHALEVRRLLRELGLESEIYVKETRAEMRQESHFYRSYEPDGSALLLYQAATGSPIAEFLVARSEPKIVNYHNLTPPEFFTAWEPHTAVELQVGRRQIADLRDHTELAVAVSAFNEADLFELGFRCTAVAPLLLDLSLFDRETDDEAHARLVDDGGEGPVVLFVGRLAPNKAQHDLVKALVALRNLYAPAAKLRLVGAPSSPRYQRALRGFVAALDLEGAVSLPGSVSDGELAAHYRAADVFVCLSEHEGFCVPILEAMYHELPVIALAAAAVPETVGDAGILLPDKDPGTVAAAIDRVSSDAGLRSRLVDAGRDRLRTFGLEPSRRRFQSVIAPLLEAS